MRLPGLFGGRPAEREPEEADEAVRDRRDVDASVPRACVYKLFDDTPGPCPKCGGALTRQSAVYAVATFHGDKPADPFLAGTDFGWFCDQCPTVVIDPARVEEFLQNRMPHWDVGEAFGVLGLVDLDAVPEEKRHRPLGEDDDPVPLVHFSDVTTIDAGERAVRPRAATEGERVAMARRRARRSRKKSR